MGDEEKNWKKLIHALESLLVCLKEILKVKNGKTKIDIRSNIESFVIRRGNLRDNYYTAVILTSKSNFETMLSPKSNPCYNFR